jgi:transcriptional regulator with AAA-type ATPase domain
MLRLTIHCNGEVRHFPMPRDAAHLGSASENDLVVPFPGVSRRHALLTPRPGGLLLTDLGSTNGLVRDGRRCDETLLTPGKAIRLGHAVLVLEELSSSDAEAALRLQSAGGSSHGMLPTRETGAFRPTPTACSPMAALRWVREVEGLGQEVLDERRGELTRGARTALGAESLLVFSAAGDELAVMDCDGPLPDGNLLDRLAAEASAVTGEPLLLDEPRPTLLTTAPGGLCLAGFFTQVPDDWQRDFFAYAAEKLLPGEFPHGSRCAPPSPPEGRLRLPPGMVVGTSAAIQALLRQLEATVWSDLNVLLTGETGTGKELFARLVHGSGPHARGPFVAINCAAIPAELLESELFGVTARVATGVDPRLGLFVQANGGTIFLDEIGEMPERLQAKLLRVLQEREVMSLGATAPRKIQVRVIAASNRDLAESVREGGFRADLYYRLRGLELHLPPLRQRREDLPHFVLAFAGRAAARYGKRLRGVSRGALTVLLAHDWPGNIRELANEVERAVLLCPAGGLLQKEHFGTVDRPRPVRTDEPTAGEVPRIESRSLQDQVDALERQAILTALAAAKGNKTAAARSLGITRNGLTLKMKRLGIS